MYEIFQQQKWFKLCIRISKCEFSILQMCVVFDKKKIMDSNRSTQEFLMFSTKHNALLIHRQGFFWQPGHLGEWKLIDSLTSFTLITLETLVRCNSRLHFQHIHHQALQAFHTKASKTPQDINFSYLVACPSICKALTT